MGIPGAECVIYVGYKAESESLDSGVGKVVVEAPVPETGVWTLYNGVAMVGEDVAEGMRMLLGVRCFGAALEKLVYIDDFLVEKF